MSTTAKVSAKLRINSLLDENSFVEIGGLVTARNTDFNLKSIETPADGVVTGYGLIDGNLVYVYAQDTSVLGGSVGEMHAKKITGLYDLAMKTGAPVIGLIDSAGLRLQEATDALNAFGEIYYKQTLASGVIPQITAIFGACGGGLSIIPALTDFTLIEKSSGRLFVNSPNTLDENSIEKCDTASAAFQSEETGAADFIGSEYDILSKIRELITLLPCNNEEVASCEVCTDDLNRVCEGMENCFEDTSYALSNISDNGLFVEVKSSYAKEMIIGFIRLNGMTVGTIANRTKVYDDNMNIVDSYDARLTAKGCEKAADFVNFCDAFNIPVLTLTNSEGYSATACEEKIIAKKSAKLVYAFANATVPKVNVIVGKAYGSAYVTMNSKALGADVVFALPTASIGMMEADMAARVIYADEINSSDNAVALINEKTAEYSSLQNSVEAAARRGYVDNIITPEDIRKHLIGTFEMLFTKREDRPSKKHGTV